MPVPPFDHLPILRGINPNVGSNSIRWLTYQLPRQFWVSRTAVIGAVIFLSILHIFDRLVRQKSFTLAQGFVDQWFGSIALIFSNGIDHSWVVPNTSTIQVWQLNTEYPSQYQVIFSNGKSQIWLAING